MQQIFNQLLHAGGSLLHAGDVLNTYFVKLIFITGSKPVTKRPDFP